MKIALFGKSVNNYNLEPIKLLVSIIEKKGWELIVYEEFYRLLRDKNVFSKIVQIFNSPLSTNQTADLFFSLGGDGTILNALPYVLGTPIPVVGVNTGRLGFLASIGIDEIEAAIENIEAKHYQIEKRSIITLETTEGLFGNLNFALNEFTIHKSDSSSMITIHTFLNGEFLNSYWADGLIVSTPTGSTAYSLSCGGPIAMPDSENFIISPISPHNLNVRPLIISDKDILTLRVEGRNRHYLVSLDSRSTQIDATVEMTVKKASNTINLLRLQNKSFTESLRNKLMWGIDKRN
ncbi:MAG: NAD kinase [Bacteroidota bacterium]|jgi:NAD+ kinase